MTEPAPAGFFIAHHRASIQVLRNAQSKVTSLLRLAVGVALVPVMKCAAGIKLEARSGRA